MKSGLYRNQANKTKRAFKSQVNGEPEKGRRKQTANSCAISRLDIESVNARPDKNPPIMLLVLRRSLNYGLC